VFILSTSDDRFFCQICDDRLPTFSNSFFDTSDDVNINDDLPCHTDVNIENDQNNNIIFDVHSISYSFIEMEIYIFSSCTFSVQFLFIFLFQI
jgi:hypothetical protein